MLNEPFTGDTFSHLKIPKHLHVYSIKNKKQLAVCFGGFLASFNDVVKWAFLLNAQRTNLARGDGWHKTKGVYCRAINCLGIVIFFTELEEDICELGFVY